MDLDERLARADRLQLCGEQDVATLAGDVRTLVAELRAARAEVERLTTERDDARRAHVCAVADAQRRREKARAAMLDAWRDAEACEAEIERLRTAAADERADAVAYLNQVGAKLRKERPRTDYLDAQADTYERASEAIADECHVGAAKGGECG